MAATAGPVDLNNLKTEVDYRTRLQDITNKIYAAVKIDEIFIDLRDEITSLFEADRMTIYYVDGVKRELVSRYKSGVDRIAEIRVPISPDSIAGYAAYNQTFVNIEDVYDQKELESIDPDLRFDSNWDKKSGYRTRQVLVAPVIYKTLLLGAVQLINRKDDQKFTEHDVEYVKELAEVLGIALFNQKRLAKNKTQGKFGYLQENHIISVNELNAATTKSRLENIPIEKILMDDYKVSRSDIGRSLARYYNLPFVEFSKQTPIPGELLAGLNTQFMKSNNWVPVRKEDDLPLIAIDDPLDLDRTKVIKRLFPGKTIQFAFAFKEDIQEFINLFTSSEKELASIDQILSQMRKEDSEEEEAETGVSEESSAVVQLVNKIILEAFAKGASDIHIEPYMGRQNTEVRIRIDGACTLYQTIPFSYRNAIVSRIKIMADLDIAERRKPQDGKIKFKKYGGKDIELRVATVPTQGGVEDVVMRILAAGEPIPLERIGFTKKNFENFVSAITKPYGIIFVCGPTGSGKTTTLHSALGYINKPETKIWTAEDPVEITQRGLRQVQVQSKIGFTFAAAMRAFLRADPDVIMVGEMRDHETTQIGIEASLTGHLVFSTLHTNSAPESITRLLDMGMDPFNFADAILAIMAQRLLRTLCKTCKEEYHPTEAEYNELVREYGEEHFKKNINIPYTDDLTLYRAVGCEKCSGTGYSGRMGIHELLMGTDRIKRLIQEKARMEIIRDTAIEEGMCTLKQDGIEKIFGGYTDLLQVRKVCIK